MTSGGRNFIKSNGRQRGFPNRRRRKSVSAIGRCGQQRGGGQKKKKGKTQAMGPAHNILHLHAALCSLGGTLLAQNGVPGCEHSQGGYTPCQIIAWICMCGNAQSTICLCNSFFSSPPPLRPPTDLLSLSFVGSQEN